MLYKNGNITADSDDMEIINLKGIVLSYWQWKNTGYADIDGNNFITEEIINIYEYACERLHELGIKMMSEEC